MLIIYEWNWLFHLWHRLLKSCNARNLFEMWIDSTFLCLQTKSPALQAPQQWKPVPTPPTETELPAENPTDDTRLDALPTLFSLVKKRHARFPSATATTQFVSPETTTARLTIITM